MPSEYVKQWFEKANAKRPKVQGVVALKRVTIISTAMADSRILASHLTRFGKESDRYRYLKEESFELSSAGLLDAVILHRVDQEPRPILAFTSGDGASLSLTNIVPETVSSIDWKSYNAFASSFVLHFGAWVRQNALVVQIKQTSGRITLKDIVPGAKTRQLFEAFLARHPLSRHFHDTRRLDTFICGLHRHCRGRIQTSDLERYLIQVLGWSEADAEWCVQRIDVGLEVLATYSG